MVELLLSVVRRTFTERGYDSESEPKSGALMLTSLLASTRGLGLSPYLPAVIDLIAARLLPTEQCKTPGLRCRLLEAFLAALYNDPTTVLALLQSQPQATEKIFEALFGSLDIMERSSSQVSTFFIFVGFTLLLKTPSYFLSPF